MDIAINVAKLLNNATKLKLEDSGETNKAYLIKEANKEIIKRVFANRYQRK